nr:MAG TPA: hypothetical protein [Caudoviricetes sp.]DAV12713.1 MAG TPA: hypothetical protein [Caudoviricetes sp.]
MNSNLRRRYKRHRPYSQILFLLNLTRLILFQMFVYPSLSFIFHYYI